jgi:hypothetical protein
MSDNPFAEQPDPDPNPYAPPSPSPNPYVTPPPLPESAGNPLLAPAIFLLVLASLFLLATTATLPRQIVRLSKIDPSVPNGVAELIGGIVGTALFPLTNLAVILGAISMLRLKNYRNARLAAIVSIFPFCSPCILLGIPFGIWAFIVLNRPEVKARFTTR